MRWAGREARARVVLHRRGVSTIRSHVWTTTDTCLILPRQAQDDQLTSLPFQYCRMDFVPVGGRSCGTVPQRHRSDAFRCEETLMPLFPIASCSCQACLGKSSCVFLFHLKTQTMPCVMQASGRPGLLQRATHTYSEIRLLPRISHSVRLPLPD